MRRRDVVELAAIIFVAGTAIENCSGVVRRGLQMGGSVNLEAISIRSSSFDRPQYIEVLNYLIYCRRRLVSREPCRLVRRIHRWVDAALAASLLFCKIYSNCQDAYHRMLVHLVDQLWLVSRLNSIAIVESDSGCRLFVHFVLETIVFAVMRNAFDFVRRSLPHSGLRTQRLRTFVSAVQSVVRDAIDFGSLEMVGVDKAWAAIQIVHKYVPVDLLSAFGLQMSSMLAADK